MTKVQPTTDTTPPATSTEVATAAPAVSALALTGSGWTPAQRAALGQLGLADAPDPELAVLFHMAARTGLDVFARQLYLIGRQESYNENGQWHKRTKYTIQTGIDGFRLVARRAVDRTGETLGYLDTEWCGDDGRWSDVWLKPGAPAAARVTVLRDGQRFPGVATLREYAGTKSGGDLTKMWSEKGALMLAKCAEALALRRAFPQDLSGMYVAEEMAKRDSEQQEPQQRTQRPHRAEQRPDDVTGAAVLTTPDQLAEHVAEAERRITQAEAIVMADCTAAQRLERLRGVWTAAGAGARNVSLPSRDDTLAVVLTELMREAKAKADADEDQGAARDEAEQSAQPVDAEVVPDPDAAETAAVEAARDAAQARK